MKKQLIMSSQCVAMAKRANATIRSMNRHKEEQGGGFTYEQDTDELNLVSRFLKRIKVGEDTGKLI